MSAEPWRRSGTPVASRLFAWQAWYFGDLRLDLCGRCGTLETFVQGRPRIAKPRMMKENGAKKRTAHTGSFRQQTQRTRGDAKKTMLRNCLGHFKESMQS